MSGIGIAFKIAEDTVTPALQRLLAAGADLRPAHEDIGAHLVFETIQRFEEEKDPDGNPWPPSLRALAEGGQTLTQSGRLKASQTYNVLPDGVEQGTDVIYAAIHQSGGDAGRDHKVRIPARPFLGINDEDETYIAHAYERLFSAAAGDGARA